MKPLLATLTFILFSLNVNADVCTKITIKDTNGKTVTNYNVDEALTKRQQRNGLMNRQHMPDNYGMLFTWKQHKIRYMWMKNTFLPLDMVFIENGKILGIIPNTSPNSTRTLSVYQPTNQVLEINAGQAKKHGIKRNYTVTCTKKVPVK